jgi:hypothetical protein
VQQTTSILAGGQVTRLTQRFSSVDGRRHSVDAEFAQSIAAPSSGESPGFEFPGQTSFATHAVPDSFSPFPNGPGSVIVLGNPVQAPAVSNPIGAITFSRPPVSADFVSSAGTRIATFLMRYTDTIPAGGSIEYDWSFSQAASAAGLGPIEAIERDRFATPSIFVINPRNRAVVRYPTVSVRGVASDAVGLSSVTVDSQRVALTAAGAFSALVRVRPGRNGILITATNDAGNAVTVPLTVTYKPLPCTVPRLRGRTLAAARAALEFAGCAAGRVTRVHSRHVRRGRVISSSPSAGARRPPGTRVALVVSRGR